MADNNSQALVFGEILFDVYEDGAYLGGAPLNFAWYLRQFGISAAMVSAIGDDPYGAQVRTTLQQVGVDQALVSCVDAPTGTVDVTLTNGQPRYVINKGVAWDKITCRTDGLSRPQLLYYGTLAQRTECNRDTLHTLWQLDPPHRFFDVNLRQNYYDQALVTQGLLHSSIVKLNDVEWGVLSAMLGQSGPRKVVHDYNLQALIVTYGELGASLFDRHGRHDAPSPHVTVVDAVGAGDAFSAAMAAAAIRGYPLERALPVACEVGAYVVTVRGAQTVLPARLAGAFG